MSPPRPALPGLSELADPASLSRMLLDRMSEGVSLSREDGIIVYTNPAEDRMFGYGAGELVGQHVSVQNAYPPEENDRVVAGVIAELKRSGGWTGEWRNRRKDGSAFTTRSRISAMEIGGARFWLCVQEDVTQEAATAAALREERTRLALATDAAQIGIWDWDVRTGRMIYSDRAKEISGLPAEAEVTFEDARRIVHPEDLPNTSAQARRAFDPLLRDRSPYEYRILREDGSIRWVLAHGEAVFEDEGGAPKAVRYLGTIQDITARKELEDAERNAARKLRLALEASRMAVWDLDAASGTVARSPGLNRLLGFPEDEPLDLDAVRACYAPGEHARLQAESAAALARGETSFETGYRFIRPDGVLRWLRLRYDVLFDEQGKPVRAIGVVADETERRAAEEDLKASEARLQLASAAASIGVWEMNFALGRSVWSPEEFALFGLDPATPADACYDAWCGLLHPEDRAEVLDWIARARVEAGSHSLDYRILRPGGEPRWIRSQASTLLGPDGQPGRMVGVEFDVTAEIQRTEALRDRAAALAGKVEAQQRELDRFFALSGDLFAVADFEGRLRSINLAWSRLLGRSEAELLARPFVELIHPDDRAAAAEVVGRLRGGASIQRFEDRLVTAEGRAAWIAWAAVPEGELFYAVGRDVTQEREREEILRQGQKMEAVGQLTGGIAHDFNNLLQAVQGSFALIAKQPAEPGRVRVLAEQGLEATRRGGSLTAQLLAFSRSQRLEVRPVPVLRVLGGMKDLLERSLGPLWEVRLDPAGAEIAAHADPTQLEMAVLNLCINARDAMPGGGAIRIRVEPQRLGDDPELPGGDYLAVRVSDGGTGMSPEVARRAFEPFFTTKGLGKGTGLGLSQVYAMARQSGGTVRIDTRAGEGTTVSILLRRAEAAEGADAPGAAPADGSGRPRPAATILVVDDDDAVRRSLVASVEALGHRAIEAGDGKAGLAALELGPDLLLADFAMPGMTGAELAQEARRRRPGLPIVLMTGYGDSAAIEGAMGADHPVLRKPFDLGELDAALAARLGPGRSGPGG